MTAQQTPATHLCPHCGEGELVPFEKWLKCEGCGRGYLQEDLDEWRERKIASNEHGELMSVYWDSIRRQVPGGGGDDGLRLVVLRPLGDERFVSATTETLNPRPHVLQVTGVDADTEECRKAMQAWIADPPTPEEVAQLKTLGGL